MRFVNAQEDIDCSLLIRVWCIGRESIADMRVEELKAYLASNLRRSAGYFQSCLSSGCSSAACGGMSRPGSQERFQYTGEQ